MTTFEEIARTTLEECEGVDCSIEEFAEGLTIVIEELKIARDAAEECASAIRENEQPSIEDIL